MRHNPFEIVRMFEETVADYTGASNNTRQDLPFSSTINNACRRKSKVQRLYLERHLPIRTLSHMGRSQKTYIWNVYSWFVYVLIVSYQKTLEDWKRWNDTNRQQRGCRMA